MLHVTCPNCRSKYDPGLLQGDVVGLMEMTLKVACPVCGQWVALDGTTRPVRAPDCPPDFLREAMAQARVVENVAEKELPLYSPEAIGLASGTIPWTRTVGRTRTTLADFDPPAAATARIEAVADPAGPRVLTRRNFLLVAIPCSAFLATGLALAVWRLWIVVRDWAELSWWSVAGGLLLGALAVLAGVFATALLSEQIASRIFVELLRRRVRARAGRSVDPDAANAIPVEMTPREVWGRAALQRVMEGGFLKVGADAVRFEGDCERWVIPYGSILGCEVVREPDGVGPQSGQFAVLLQARTPSGLWEAPLHVTYFGWRFDHSVAYEELAQSLRRDIIDRLPEPRRRALLDLQPLGYWCDFIDGTAAAKMVDSN